MWLSTSKFGRCVSILELFSHNAIVVGNERVNKIKSGVIRVTLVVVGIIILIVAVIFLSFSGRDREVFMQSYKSFQFVDQSRKYLISKPKSVDQDSRVIIGLHGYGDFGRRFAYYSGLHNSARPNDIVAYPQAIEPQPGQISGWNAGFCCGSGWKQNIADDEFIVALGKSIAEQYGVDNSRLYVTGFSNGAFMAQRLATEHPQAIKAVASVAGSAGTKDQQISPSGPVPILLIHGDQDKTVPFNGGASKTDPDFVWKSYQETKQLWQNNNQDIAPVESFVYQGVGHQWPNWRIVNFWHKRPQASNQVIEFFNNN